MSAFCSAIGGCDDIAFAVGCTSTAITLVVLLMLGTDSPARHRLPAHVMPVMAEIPLPEDPGRRTTSSDLDGEPIDYRPRKHQGESKMKAHKSEDVTLTETLREGMAQRRQQPGAVSILPPPDPNIQKRLAAVQAGMEETQAIIAEREHYKRLYEEERVRNAELVIQIEQAREQERLHVRKVTDELVTAGRAAEADKCALEREIASLHQRFVSADWSTRRALERAARLDAFVLLVRAGIERTLADEAGQSGNVGPQCKGAIGVPGERGSS